ncbi:MAG TPA: Phenylacetic acid catabolic protein, partial [Candidatus Limnocylindrales bacterium]|nr:Phenylacetic acid catabolic protein [Candidatus Limnocylindrales bacterium]
GRGDWAMTIARRFLYDTADAARLASIGDGWAPLAELVAKIRREERYHLMHALAWVDRLARAGGEARARFVAGLEALAPDAPTVLAAPDYEAALLDAGILTRPMAEAFAGWRTEVTGILGPLGISISFEPPRDAARARAVPSDDFRWLWGEFTSVRRSDPGATW